MCSAKQWSLLIQVYLQNSILHLDNNFACALEELEAIDNSTYISNVQQFEIKVFG
jgi:hypothetical protein